jgi:predicted RNA-binding protein with PIN domain
MPPHLLIDGYNYIGRTSLEGMPGLSDSEVVRDLLLDRLVEYRKNKGARVTVVFDAYAGVHLARSRTNYKGIEVIYSGRDETADDVIRQLIRTRPAGLVVVSSDRALIDEAKRHGVVFMVPGRLEAALAGEAEEEVARGSERKGTARRLPKRVRKARRTLGKV